MSFHYPQLSYKSPFPREPSRESFQ